jgi:regulator of protease activity HflC (stomatin/prohibitin superfamily)
MTVSNESMYQKASAAAVAGLLIQSLLSVATGLIGIWAQSPAIYAVTWHILGGLPIWAILALVFQQHQAERAETLAAEKLSAQDATSAAIFGDLGDELQLARGRLDRLYSWGLPAVSFAVAAYLLGAGGWLLWRVLRPTGEAPTFLSNDCNPVGLMFAAGGIAFVAFVASRWVSGYSRVREWQLLRGGASYLMSTFVLAAVIFIGAASASIVGDRGLFAWLATAIPVMMMFVGGEILLTQLLAAYRPKRPGEVPRPAFDSRVLGLLTAPDSLGQVVGELISYQFGVEVSRSWVYRLLAQAVTPLTLFAGLVLLGLSAIVIVGPDEQAVIMRFGAIARDSVGAGMHFKWPWPIETAEVYPTGKVLQLTVSSDLLGRPKAADALLWTAGDDKTATMGLEYFLCGSESQAGTGGGMALVMADVIVQYRVGDLVTFLEGSLAPRDAITVVTQQEVSRHFSSRSIDTLLSRSRTDSGAELRRRIQTRLDGMGLGFEVVDVSISSLQPPAGQVARAFHRQIGAQQHRETLIQEARKDEIATLAKVAGSVEQSREIDRAILTLDSLRQAGERPDAAAIAAQELVIDKLLGEARGEAAEFIHAARAYRWTRAVGERSARDRFAGEMMAYRAAPGYYRTRRYLDVLANGLAKQRKLVIAGPEGDLPVLEMDLSDSASALDTLLGE